METYAGEIATFRALLKTIHNDTGLYLTVTPSSAMVQDEDVNPYVTLEDRVAQLQSTLEDLRGNVQELSDLIYDQPLPTVSTAHPPYEKPPMPPVGTVNPHVS